MANQKLINQAESIMARMVELGFKVEGGICMQDAQREWRRVINKLESGEMKPKKKK